MQISSYKITSVQIGPLQNLLLFFKDGQTFWKCTETGKKRKYCKVRLHCKEGHIMQVKGEHTHAPYAAEVDAKRAMAMLFEQKRSLHYMNLILFMITLCELHTISRFRRWLLNS